MEEEFLDLLLKLVRELPMADIYQMDNQPASQPLHTPQGTQLALQVALRVPAVTLPGTTFPASTALAGLVTLLQAPRSAKPMACAANRSMQAWTLAVTLLQAQHQDRCRACYQAFIMPP